MAFHIRTQIQSPGNSYRKAFLLSKMAVSCWLSAEIKRTFYFGKISEKEKWRTLKAFLVQSL